MRSMLMGFPTEKLRLIKADGRVVENIEALVEPKKIFVDDASVIIEEGDIFERILSNGAVENYEVLDRGFYKGMHGIPDHYQTSVRKTTAKSYNTNARVTYNINNESGKININSTDNSLNVNVSLSKEDEALFDTLKSLASSLNNNDEICKLIDEMRNSVGKETFSEKYNNFIQSAANHITVFAPFIPMISNLLTR
jgi:hypothetical protein